MSRQATFCRLLVAVVVLALAAPALAVFSGTDVFLPSVGRAPGKFGSQWYTVVWIFNPSASPAHVTIAFLERNQPNPAPPLTYGETILPGETVRHEDIITNLFRIQRFGALHITSDEKVLVNCRVYDQPVGAEEKDSKGQFYAGTPASFAIGAGQSTQLLGVYQTSPLADSQFRYNFGFVETHGGTATVRVIASTPDGSVAGQWDHPPMGPYEVRYYDKLADLLPGINTTNLRLEVQVVAGDGRIIAVGSGVANRSNDASTFEMAFKDELLADGSGGLTSVAHDATLTGDGTGSSPLGIANGGVTKGKLAASGGTPGQVLGTDGLDLVWLAAGLTLPFTASGTSTGGNSLFRIGDSGVGYAIAGVSATGTALLGMSGSGSSFGLAGGPAAVWGDARTGAGYGVAGTSATGSGLLGDSDTGYGVQGRSTAAAVFGLSTGSSGYGVYGKADGATARGVYGDSQNGDGMVGVAHVSGRSGVYAVNHTAGGFGVNGASSAGYGVYGSSTSGYAGYFQGRVQVNGELSKSSGSFVIDHPLDPESRYLFHSFVESPDMKNVYDGIATLDENGRGEVELPTWFEALNRDFRYQLTCIGGFAPVYIAEEITENRFTIAGGAPGMKVSWQVTGIRKDPWADAHRIAVERPKPADEKGLYLHPELYGQPESKGIEWVRRAEGSEHPGVASRPD